MSLLIVGCGYVGEQLAQSYLNAGEKVWALTRSIERAKILEGMGLKSVIGHWLDKSLDLSSVAEDGLNILISIPHRDDVGLGPETHRLGLENLTRSLTGRWRRLVYLSTTGVYGQTQAETVNELTTPNPQRLAGEMAIQAEHWLTQLPEAQSCVTLRLAGIYGPGRVPHFETLRREGQLAVPSEGYLNLIHVADICRAIRSVFEQPVRQSCYVLSDGFPVMRADFYREIARLCGLKDVVFSQPDPASARSVRSATSKRVSPLQFFHDYDFQPKYTNYREGLTACLANAQQTPQ